MSRKTGPLVFAGLIVVAFAATWLLMPRAGSGSNVAGGSADWEFPRDSFLHDNDEQRSIHAALLGKPMPPLDLSQWENGSVMADDMKGKVVVIDFWATWCEQCFEAVPRNNELYAKYHDQGLEMIGVCTEEGQEKYAQTVKDKGFNYPTACD